MRHGILLRHSASVARLFLSVAFVSMLARRPDPNMAVDSVNSSNRSLGRVLRKDLFRSPGGFRTVHVLVLNHAGELLLQQLPEHQKRHPLAWGSSVAGYLFAGESYLEGAVRRVGQELGIEAPSLRRCGIIKVDDLGHDKFVGVCQLEAEGPFIIDPEHIREIAFFKLEDLAAQLSAGTIVVTPTFRAVFEWWMNQRR